MDVPVGALSVCQRSFICTSRTAWGNNRVVAVMVMYVHVRAVAGKDSSVELQTLAVATLRHLSLDDTLKRGIVQAGTLPVILRCNANSNNADQQCQVPPRHGQTNAQMHELYCPV